VSKHVRRPRRRPFAGWGQSIRHAGAQRVWPLLRSRPYASILAAVAALVFCASSVIGLRVALDMRGDLAGAPSAADATGLAATLIAPPTIPTIPAATLPPTAVPTPVPTVTGVVFDSSGVYAFPIAGDPATYRWTHYHWDGTNAADLEARFGLTRAQFEAATRAPLVAITSGTALHHSGNIGGLGYVLQGDDGIDYYYGHMSELWAPDGARVEAGQPLGRIGNTGGTAQFIEPHLHLAIGPRDTLWDQPASINAAEHLQTLFGLAWQSRPTPAVPFAQPAGSPVTHPDARIVTPFERAQAGALAEPAVEIGVTPGAAETLDVVSTLDGVVNVSRWTEVYGTRIQITNEAADSTVVISGVQEWLVEDGDVVMRGQVVGRWNPAQQPALHYMIYQNGVLIDPTPALGLPVAE